MWGIIINWADTLASIPANWLLCDGNSSTPNLLGKYLLSVGTGENPGTTGGNTTHTHTSPEHTHTQDTHSHSGNTEVTTSSETNCGDYGSGVIARINHTHSFTTSTVIAVNQNTSITVNSVSNDPNYYKMAPIIDSTSYGVKYPASSVIFWSQTTLPNGWSLCDGNNGTPDLRNKFLKCVDSGENPGTVGGSATHTHTTVTHTHIQNSHNHTSTTSSASITCPSGGGGDYYLAFVYSSHTHTLTINDVTATNQNSTVDMSTTNNEPTFKKLLIIKNTGIANRPKYAIVVWIGTLSNIPLGYVLCDGSNNTPDLRNYFIKGANDIEELESTGGSSIHNHTANSHNHTQDLHNHTTTANVVGASSGRLSGGSTVGAHSHPVYNVSGTTTNQSTTITIDNCSSQANYPPYYKVAFIMQDRELDIGAYAFIVT